MWGIIYGRRVGLQVVRRERGKHSLKHPLASGHLSFNGKAFLFNVQMNSLTDTSGGEVMDDQIKYVMDGSHCTM